MWEGFLSLGGHEILNSARVYGYTRSAGCPIRLVHDRPHEGMHLAFGDDVPYSVSDMESAPWYDPDDPATTRFYGAYPVSVVGLSDSTASADVQQRVGAGGIIGRTRESTRQVRVRALLVGEGEEAVEAGMTWLKAALAAQTCGVHGALGMGCGLSDAAFFVAEPPEHTGQETPAEYRQRVAPLRRNLHNVKRVSGPLVESKRSAQGGRVFLYSVTFVLESELPWVFSDTTLVNVPPSPPVVIQDAPFNLVPYPSAEIADGTAVVSTQYATNPSVEADSTGWNVEFATVSGSSPSPFTSQGRVVGELAAVGTASCRGRILGDGSTTASGRARITIYHDIDISDTPTGTRMSFNIWGALVNVGGATGFAVQSIRAVAYWRTASADISNVVIGTGVAADAGGKPYSIASVPKPSTATRVRVAVEFVVDWRSNATASANSDIRAYADAVAATVP